MGYTTRGSITDFWPDDTEDKKYLVSDVINLESLYEKIKEWWPNTHLSNISISSEKIHTSCIYYDLYDPSDYTDFIIIERVKND